MPLCRQQLLELLAVDEVAAHRVLEVGLPVQLHGTLEVALVVGAGVLVDLDEDQAGVAEVLLGPVGGDEHVVAAHGDSSCDGDRMIGRSGERAGRQRPPDEQVQLAAQAEAGGRVEQGRHERQPGGDGAERRGAQQIAGGAHDGEEQADELGEPRRRLGLPLADRTQPRRDQHAGNSTPYGAYRRPANAPTANTTAWTATSTPLPVSRATARTTVVTQAPKRGPRTSIRRAGSTVQPWEERPPDGGQGTSGRAGLALRRSDRGSCRRGTGPLCGARSAWCPRGESSRSRAPAPTWASTRAVSSSGRGAPLLRPSRLPSRREVEQRRRAADVELAHLVEVALGVDVHVGQPGPGGLQLLQAGPGGAARARRTRWRTGRR